MLAYYGPWAWVHIEPAHVAAVEVTPGDLHVSCSGFAEDRLEMGAYEPVLEAVQISQVLRSFAFIRGRVCRLLGGRDLLGRRFGCDGSGPSSPSACCFAAFD